MNETISHISPVSDKLNDPVLRLLLGAIEMRDPQTRDHSIKVAAYSAKLATVMGLEGEDQIALTKGALLHDLGKIGVPDLILTKRGPLEPDECAVMREHVNYGLAIIDGVETFSDARAAIAEHHERYDGTGYPAGLAGEAIHIYARILAVADTFDCITSDRPYCAKQSYDHAAHEIRAGAGTQFDPKVVKAFLQVSELEWEEIRESANSILALDNYESASSDSLTGGWPGYPYLEY